MSSSVLPFLDGGLAGLSGGGVLAPDRVSPVTLDQGWATLIVTRARMFFSFIPRGQITNPRLHTFHIVFLNLLFIEGN